MKKLSVALVALVVMASGVLADTVTSVNVVGYMTASIAGDPTEDMYSLITIPMTKLPAAAGGISGNTATTITDAGAVWAIDAFAVGGSAVDEPGDSTYYVEVTDGTFEGRHFYIVSNTSDTLTIADPGDLSVGDLSGASYKIIASNRIRDIFGEPGSHVLLGGSSAGDSDTVRLLTSLGWTSSIFYKNAGLLGPIHHWVQGSSIVDDLVIDRDEGIIVKRIGGEASITFNIVGEVSGNAQASIVDTGYSLINGMVAVDTAIGDTTLTNVLQAGSAPDNADTIRAWTGSGWSASVFYKDSGLIGPVNAWVQGGVDVTDTFILKAGEALLVKKNSVGNNVWERESPIK